MHTGNELEVRYLEKGCTTSWERSVLLTRVIKLNRHKTNPHKMRPYCTLTL